MAENGAHLQDRQDHFTFIAQKTSISSPTAFFLSSHRERASLLLIGELS